jgi:hypothetical protein
MLDFQESETRCWVAVVPVPVKAWTAVPVEALLLNESFAEAVPLVCGTKLTFIDFVWPAASVKGNDIALTLNSELFVVAEETVTLLPLALSVAPRLLLLPTATLPKFKLVGLIASGPLVAPDPERGTVTVKFEGLQLKDMLPLTLPVDFGVKPTFNVTLWPGVSVTGRARPVRLNPAPVTTACEMVILEAAELVSVSAEVLVLLTCTLPKLMLAGLATIVRWLVAVFP